jgi:uncharacterized membrane protein YccF (DUF307 family)
VDVLGNLVWLIFGGLLTGLGHIIGGAALCLTIVGIPFGIQSIKLGIANFLPFGKHITTHELTNSPLRVLFNIIWLIFFGWEIVLLHLLHALLLAITIIGMPFATQHLKLVPLAAFPFGRDLR